ncbi:hypothetical protein SO802_032206 [Lithocarpus litseifolius]|uniref:Uncharacterized protein n=1 Tax=Lithocarpus litseifolius TaxID=425828 RepID=A0AAW2BT74_9ROSI
MSQAAHKQLDQSLPGLFVKQDDLSLKYVLRLSIVMLSLSAHDLALIEGMAALGLCESFLYRLLTGNKMPSLNQRYWISRLYVKNGYFWRASVDHFGTKQAELLVD